MKVRYSTFRNFKIVTGKHLLELQESVENADVLTRFEALETITLGLYLLKNYPLDEARREFARLQKNEDEKYDIIDNQDVEELLNDVVG